VVVKMFNLWEKGLGTLVVVLAQYSEEAFKVGFFDLLIDVLRKHHVRSGIGSEDKSREKDKGQKRHFEKSCEDH